MDVSDKTPPVCEVDNHCFVLRFASYLTNRRVGVIGFDLAGLCGCNQISYKPPRLYTLGAGYEVLGRRRSMREWAPTF